MPFAYHNWFNQTKPQFGKLAINSKSTCETKPNSIPTVRRHHHQASTDEEKGKKKIDEDGDGDGASGKKKIKLDG